MPERRAGPDAALAAGTLALFWGVSGALYADRRWTRPLWRACRAESGRDWMVNSGVTRFDWRRAGARTHALGIAIFLTYPLWLALGVRNGRRRRAPLRATRGRRHA